MTCQLCLRLRLLPLFSGGTGHINATGHAELGGSKFPWTRRAMNSQQLLGVGIW